jgi:hypothetical protein
MNAQEIVARAQRLGLKLEAKGEKLAVKPWSICPPDLKELIQRHKLEVVALLTDLPCPGRRSIPVEGLRLNPIRPSPSAKDYELVIGFVKRQLGGPDDPLRSWCSRRKKAYQTKHQWEVKLCAYAAARDLVCHQLARTELEVCDLLSGFDECSRHLKPNPYATDARVSRLPTWRGKVTIVINEKAALSIESGCRVGRETEAVCLVGDSEDTQRRPHEYI